MAWRKTGSLGGGIRVPLCSQPGRFQSQTDELGIPWIYFPYAGAGIKVKNEIEGKSLAPIWLNGKKGDPNRTLIWVRREKLPAIRDVPIMRFGKETGNFYRTTLSNPATGQPKGRSGGAGSQPANHPMARKLISKLMLHLQKSGDMPWQK